MRLLPLATLLVAAACVGGGRSADDDGAGPPADPAASRAIIRAEVRAPTGMITPGVHEMTVDGVPARLFVPRSYDATKLAPLVVLLHGAGQDAGEWFQAPLYPVYEAGGAIVLAVSSTGPTWDFLRGGFGPDVRRIENALTATFERCRVDPRRIALGGFSDGASYALSLGVANGEYFTALIAFAPGFIDPPAVVGKPRVYIAHGQQDQVLPISSTGRVVSGLLQTAGYDLTYKEFSGRHAIYTAVVAEALAWFAAK